MTNSNMEKKGFISLTVLYLIVHHQNKWGQKPKQGRNLETLADAEATEKNYWLSPKTWSTWFHVGPRITGPVVASPSMSWTLSHLSLIKKMPYSLAYRTILQGHFLNWGSLLIDDSNLYRSWQKPSQHLYSRTH